MPDRIEPSQGRERVHGAEPVAFTLTEDTASFIESGVSIIIGVVGPDGRARAGRALASRVVWPGTIRLLFPAEGNDSVIEASRSGGPIAATFSAPLSHRTVQIKGRVSRTEEIEPEDIAIADRQSEAFAAILLAVGHAPHFVKAICDYRSSKLCVLSFPAHQAFEQTPGPGAGRAL